MTGAPVLQSRLPYTPWADPAMRRLPGIQPAAPEDAFRPDEAYGGQMALRDGLLADRPDDVRALLPGARGAAAELLDTALDRAAALPGFAATPDRVTRPDGAVVALDRDDPLGTLGRLFQEDFCLLERPGGAAEHVLTGAVLCFPSGWTLAEKIGRPLFRIHRPVPAYGDDLAPRVQRLMDALKPGRALWRANAHGHPTPELYRPLREADPRHRVTEAQPFIRSERQVLFRVPRTGAVVFSIHTIVIRREALDPDQAAALAESPIFTG